MTHPMAPDPDDLDARTWDTWQEAQGITDAEISALRRRIHGLEPERRPSDDFDGATE